MVRGGLGEAFVLVWCRGLNKQLPTGGARGSPRPARKAQQSHDACGLFNGSYASPGEVDTLLFTQRDALDFLLSNSLAT